MIPVEQVKNPDNEEENAGDVPTKTKANRSCPGRPWMWVIGVLVAIGIGIYFLLTEYLLYDLLEPQYAGEYCHSDDKCETGVCNMDLNKCTCSNDYWDYFNSGCRKEEMCVEDDGLFVTCIDQPACPPNISLASDDAAHQMIPQSEQNNEDPLRTESPGSFGRSIAIDGDRAIVGAPSIESYECLEGNNDKNPDAPSAIGGGSAYLFVREESGWILETELKPYGLEATNGFGVSVALENDTAIVGSHDACGSGSSGSAYVFVRDKVTSEWVQTQILKAGDSDNDDDDNSASLSPDRGDAFGHSLALFGDAVAIGAPGKASVYIFDRDGDSDSGVWFFSDTVGAETEMDGDPLFGFDLGLRRDAFGDFLIVGAPNNDPSKQGSAYVFQREPAENSFEEEYKRDAWITGREGWWQIYDVSKTPFGDDPEGGLSRLGASVALARRTDYEKNTDSVFLGVVGAPHVGNTTNDGGSTDNESGTEPGGSVYWYRVNGRYPRDPNMSRQPTFVRKLVPDSGSVSRRYGSSVRVSITKREGEKVLVGDPGSNAAYVFVTTPYNSRWYEETKLVLADDNEDVNGSSSNENFGAAVAISGYTVLVGSPQGGSVYAPEPLSKCFSRPDWW